MTEENLRTLVVDDEQPIRFFLEQTLQRVGHDVQTVGTGQEALDLLRDQRFDLVMLDLRLGGAVDGLRILEALRWRWPSTAAIILTGHGTLDSAVEAIHDGIDGYLLKPVEPSEVREAVTQALERRRELAAQRMEEETKRVERGDFVVDLEKHVATVGGEPADLTPREFSLLVHMMRNSPQVIGPRDLVEVVRDYRPEHTYEARDIIKWYIHRLRQKVEPEPSEPRHILNVRGVGYRFEP